MRLDIKWAGDFEYLSIMLVYNINTDYFGAFTITDINYEYEFKFTFYRDNLWGTYRISEGLHHKNTSNAPTMVRLYHQYQNPFLKRDHNQYNNLFL